MDEYDVIYLDDDERNARAGSVNHRTGGGGGRRVVVGGNRPSRSSVVVPPSKRATVIHSGSRDRRAVVLQEEPQPEKRTLIGDLTTGEVVEIAAQILAAIQPLPAAPPAAGEVETDGETLVIYQTALATHAKRDEQLRTLGSLLGKILK